jgi:DNA-binding HxlR family transcriptional regulator
MELVHHGKGDVCPVEFTLKVIGGKWKLLILFYLMNDRVKRYGELKKAIKGVTHKMLSQQLKELEAYGLVNRKEYRQIPPKVEYSLSEKGVTLLPIIGSMYDWGKANMPVEQIIITANNKID